MEVSSSSKEDVNATFSLVENHMDEAGCTTAAPVAAVVEGNSKQKIANKTAISISTIALGFILRGIIF